jgi:glycosyltransferase involved in cell wall biosynthesis
VTPRIALACSGLGRVRRGYERHTEDLFHTIQDPDLDVVLFRGRRSKEEPGVALPNLPRDFLMRRSKKVSWGSAYRWEQDTFAVTLYPELRRRRVSVVHLSDHLLTWRLYRLRQFFGGRFALLFSNGGGFRAEEFHRFEYAHVVTPGQERDALRLMPRERVFFVPYGIYPDRFAAPPGLARDESRRRHGIPTDAFVVLSVGALNFHHKRMDWVIEETAAASRDSFLVIAGANERQAPDVRALAAERLAGRHLVLNDLAPETVRELYWLADVFTLGTTEEAFGLVVLEAAAAGLPVLIHDDDHFRWMLESEESLVDMTVKGALSDRLAALEKDDALRERVAKHSGQRAAAFDWAALAADYRNMYYEIAGSSR